MGGFTLGINGQFLPEDDDVAGAAVREDRRLHDVGPPCRAGLHGEWLAAVQRGLNNVFDEEPVFIESEGNQSRDISNYDPIGQFYYVELSYKFRSRSGE